MTKTPPSSYERDPSPGPTKPPMNKARGLTAAGQVQVLTPPGKVPTLQLTTIHDPLCGAAGEHCKKICQHFPQRGFGNATPQSQITMRATTVPRATLTTGALSALRLGCHVTAPKSPSLGFVRILCAMCPGGGGVRGCPATPSAFSIHHLNALSDQKSTFPFEFLTCYVGSIDRPLLPPLTVLEI